MAVDDRPLATTDGEIAAINLQSARGRAWARFADAPLLRGIAEEIVDSERLVVQFLGDLSALDRLEALALQLARFEDSPRTALIQADVASMAHRFTAARAHLSHAALMGAARDEFERRVLAIDQACGVGLESVLSARRRIADASGKLEDLVPLGAVLADLERPAEAVAVYRRALSSYDGVSPFPPAWVCFQLGMLWGESIAVPDPPVAALWYRRAIAYVPGYVKARVHWAEICTDQGRPDDAVTILAPAIPSSDPEVAWRLADALVAQGHDGEAKAHVDAARCGFDQLLARHPLAFADHAAEFYAGSGDDRARAIELARTNVANRATRRAIQQAHALGLCA
jgi:hypothetical protein